MGVRWPALTLVMRAPARPDISSCSANGITLSSVPMSDHDGIVFHAGGPEGSKNCSAAAGRCMAARTAAVCLSTPLAKHSLKPAYGGFASQRRYRSTPPLKDTALKALSVMQELVPAVRSTSVSLSSGLNASMYTNAFTLALPVAALVITKPP